MTKSAVTDWDTTAANNTDVGGISIAEGMSPAAVNNAMREMMAQLAAKVGGYTAYGDSLAEAADAAAAVALLETDARYGWYTLASGALSGQSSLTLAVPADVVSVEIEIESALVSTDALILLRTSTTGGAPYDNGASDYTTQMWGVAGGAAIDDTSTTSYIPLQYWTSTSNNVDTGSAQTYAMHCRVTGLRTSSIPVRVRGTADYQQDSGSSQIAVSFSGKRNGTTAVTSIQFGVNTGNFTAGRYYIRGRKSP